MEQREQILSTFNITIDMLVQYYTQHLRKSMYKSLMKKCLHDLNFDESLISSIIIDEKTTWNEFQLHESGTGTKKNFDDYKLKDRIVRRTMGDFQKCMFPGVIIESRGGHNRNFIIIIIFIISTSIIININIFISI